jgi:hypothetical protein
MQVHAAMIHRDYVEENSVAGVPVFSTDGYDSVEEFLAALGAAIVAAYKADEDYYMKKVCCDRAREEHPDYKRCPECGNTLHRELDEDTGIGYCSEFLDGTCNSIGMKWERIEDEGFCFGPGAFEHMMRADCIALIHSFGAELLWYCSRGEAARLSHCDEGGNPNTPYGAVLKEHCDVGLRKGFEGDATVRLYKD